jgi:ubiquinone/menaquinone biosynthesis C-methylase UbiE
MPDNELNSNTPGQVIKGSEATRYNIQNTFNDAVFVFRKMVGLVKLYPGQQLLDIGCGPGAVLFRLHNKYGNQVKLYGIDPSDTMIEISNAKANKVGATINFSVSPGEKLQFPDAFLTGS